jgi:hypothetical protein
MQRFLLNSGLFFSALSLSACSLLVDTGKYMGGADPDGPSAPVVQITPASPVDADALTVEIVTESVDPLGAGAVTYEYRWLVDGNANDNTTPNVSADDTSDGQVWTAVVTPVSGDGERRGVAGMANVTIGGGANQPATISYVGLTTYRPIVGDRISAFSGPTNDPEGGPVAVRYAWFRNDTLIDGQVSNMLDTAGFAPGDRVRVEATARDNMGAGNTVGAGPAVVLEDVTRWRALMPNRVLGIASFVAFDPANRRYIFGYAEDELMDVSVWEYAIDDGVGGRFIQLHPTGPEPPMIGGTAVYDRRNQRVLIFGAQNDLDSGEQNSDIFVLDTSRRGAETWSVITGAGDQPAPRIFTSVDYDEERQQVVMYGGFNLGDDGFTGLNDLWTLDTSVAGGEAWTNHAVPLPPVGLIGSSLVIDPERDRAVLIGGGESTGDGPPTPSLAIYTLDLANIGDGFVMQSSVLPREMLLGSPGLDTYGQRILVGYGLASAEDGASYNDIITIDLESLEAATLVTTDPTERAGRGFIVADPNDERALVFPGGGFFDDDGGAFSLYGLAGSDLTPIHRTGVDQPGALHNAIATGNFEMYGGEDNRNGVRSEIWEFNGGSGWQLQTQLPDAISGTMPGPRAGAVLQADSNWGTQLNFIGGLAPVDPADPDMGKFVETSQPWLFQDGRWIQQTLMVGEPAIPSREGATYFMVACGGTRMGLFGGMDASRSMYLNDTAFLDCRGDRDCTWDDPVSDPTRGPLGTPAPARAYGTASRLNGESLALMFGGEAFGAGSNGTFGDMYTFYVCGGGNQSWNPPASLEGTPPEARSRHTMTLIRNDEAGALESLILFGGTRFGVFANDFGGDPLNDLHRLVILGFMTPAGESAPRVRARWEPITVASGVEDAQISARFGHVATWDDRNSRLLVYGGRRDGQTLSDMWELRIRE